MTQYSWPVRSNILNFGIQKYLLDSFGCSQYSTDECSLKTGVCLRILDAHSYTVTSLAWLPDDSGFISGSLDQKIFLWVRLNFPIVEII
jgi:WD40 repeat protein